MSMHDLTALQRDLLVLVAHVGPASGQEVKEELRGTHDVDVLPGQLYTNLDELVAAGYVSKGRRDGRTNRYSVTEEGEAVLESLAAWHRRYLTDYGVE